MLSQAPAVQLQLGRSYVHAGVLFGLGALHGYVLLMLAQYQADAIAWTALALLFCALFFWSVRTWWQTPTGVLAWDGYAWRWSLWPPEQTCQVQWTVALPGLSVLRLSAESEGVHWLLITPAMESPTQWAALRRALVASAARGRALAPGQVRG